MSAAIFILLIMCRQKYGDGVGGLMALSRLLVFWYMGKFPRKGVL